MRLIDTDKIEYATDNESDCEMKFVTKEMIDSMPTVDVTQVVRCKYCRRHNEAGFCQHICQYTDDLDYCSNWWPTLPIMEGEKEDGGVAMRFLRFLLSVCGKCRATLAKRHRKE